jgi:peptide/nickel transport system permease protein
MVKEYNARKMNFTLSSRVKSVALFFRLLLKNPSSRFGLALIIAEIMIAVLAPYISPYDPLKININDRLAPPSYVHFMGTDEYGRDILSRLIWGARVSLFVGVVVVTVALVIGFIAGAIAGFFGSWVDNFIMRVADVFLAFPGVLLAIGIMAALGVSVPNLIIALSIVFWPSFARVVRSEALSVSQSEYVQASRVIGSSRIRIIVEHILPNTVAPVIIVATLGIGFVILSESALDFLGLGVNQPTPSWGNMIADGRPFFISSPYQMLFPGIMITLTVLAFNLLGDSLRDALDPKLRI